MAIGRVRLPGDRLPVPGAQFDVVSISKHPVWRRGKYCFDVCLTIEWLVWRVYGAEPYLCRGFADVQERKFDVGFAGILGMKFALMSQLFQRFLVSHPLILQDENTVDYDGTWMTKKSFLLARPEGFAVRVGYRGDAHAIGG